ncbi:MAG: carbamoyltransferase N-terminal domain-containing protein [Verrucomicrobiota bacterium]|jgi:carbamoyltransferase
MQSILGISAHYHDSAAAIVVDGKVVAAAQEERFTRRKNDDAFPVHAARFCLARAGLGGRWPDAVVFYDKPIPKFARFLETVLGLVPGGLGTFVRFAPGWLSEKLDARGGIRADLGGLPESVPVLFTEHHQAHAASAFYPSPFDSAAVLAIDGVGEYATTTLWHGSGAGLEALEEVRFPHSLGLLYSAFTAHCGFRVNSGEYKLMGLAPYGRPAFEKVIRDRLIDLRADGSFRLNLEYFDFLRGQRLTNERFDALLGGPPRQPDERILARHADMARSIQVVTEEAMLRLARRAHERTGERHLALAGGVALNCVANGRILREGPFEKVWVQPAAGDAGGALGAALAAWHLHARQPRPSPGGRDAMHGSSLGPEHGDAEVAAVLDRMGAVHERMEDEELFDRTAAWLEAGKVVGWFQGRMEFGPRALGNRSILGDPRSAEMQARMNLRVKFRESFRPFAPAVLAEHASALFELEGDSPYMLLVAPVREALRRPEASGAAPGAEGGEDLSERVRRVRSTLPAITHVDWSARIQTVDRESNPRFRRLLEAWHARTGCPALVNTSFNVRGEPVVCTPEDAYRCFVNTAMDRLVIGNRVLQRSRQPAPVPQVFEPGRD